LGSPESSGYPDRGNFDVELQALEGNFHLLQEGQFSSVTDEKRSLVPPVNARPQELQDLIAYLGQLTGVKPGVVPAVQSASGGVDFSRLLHPKPGDWLTYNGNLNGNRYSELNQINTTNVSRLTPDEGIRGFLTAFKASTGERLWRFWTIPKKGEAGSETWPRKEPVWGGGSTWLTGSYDPETDTLFWPTGNPWPDDDDRERGGDNLYTDCVLALDPATGKLKWHYQFTPHDLCDWDATEPNVLVDATYQGQVASRCCMLTGMASFMCSTARTGSCF
jgi:hypothetical protein